MYTLIALAAFLLLLAIFSDLLTWKIKKPLSLLLPVSYAAVMCYLNLIFNGLSFFNAVNKIGTVVALTITLLCWGLIRRQDGVKNLKKVMHLFQNLIKVNIKAFSYFTPLFGALLLVCIIYPPTTWDSMTYHMGRVAHWIQNQSVYFYYTPNIRQNFMPPGPSYVVLFFQIISGDDRLANCVQFFSYVFLFSNLIYCSRVIGIKKKWIPQILVITLLAPMFLSQATSTQTDLCAALFVGTTSASLFSLYTRPFSRTRFSDLWPSILSLTALVLSKPTGLVAVFPFLLFGIFFQIRHFEQLLKDRKKLLGLISFGGISCLLFLGFEIFKRITWTEKDSAWILVYPTTSEFTFGRFFNFIPAICQHMPAEVMYPKIATRFFEYFGQPVPPLYCGAMYHLIEDHAGNALQFGLIFLGTLFWVCYLIYKLVSKKKVPWTAVSFGMLAISSFVFFSFMIRDQKWLTRLQLPIFLFVPFLFAGSKKILTLKTARTISCFLAITTTFAVILGVPYAVNNKNRPLLPLYIYHPSLLNRAETYYSDRRIKYMYDPIFSAVELFQCKNIGLFTVFDDYDYPMTWQAYSIGAMTRHIKEETQWPCILFVTLDLYFKSWKSFHEWTSISPYVWIHPEKVGYSKLSGGEIQKTSVRKNAEGPMQVTLPSTLEAHDVLEIAVRCSKTIPLKESMRLSITTSKKREIGSQHIPKESIVGKEFKTRVFIHEKNDGVLNAKFENFDQSDCSSIVNHLRRNLF